MWDLNSLTRDWTCIPELQDRFLTTGPPRKYLYLHNFYFLTQPKHIGSLDISNTDTMYMGFGAQKMPRQHLQKEVWMHEQDSLSVIHMWKRRWEHQGSSHLTTPWSLNPYSNIFPTGMPRFLLEHLRAAGITTSHEQSLLPESFSASQTIVWAPFSTKHMPSGTLPWITSYPSQMLC